MMGNIFGGGGQDISTSAERLDGIQLQTSSYGGPVSIVIGARRVPANLLDYADFKAIPHTTTSGGGGGGSGMSSPTYSNTTYEYRAGVVFGLVEGPIPSIGQVWADKDRGNIYDLGLSLQLGDRSQGFTGHYRPAGHELGYGGTCLVYSAALALTSSAQLRNHSFEVYGFLTAGVNPVPNAADILQFLLTDPICAEWPASRLADLRTGPASYWTYCQASNFWLAMLLDQQRPALEWVREVLEASNSEAVWTSNGTNMVLKVVPYGDQPVTGWGTTYTPNSTPVYDLGPDDFMPPEGEDPITVEIVSLADSFNSIPVEFIDAQIGYNINVQDDPDQADVDTYGLRRSSPVALHCITIAEVAKQISGIKARRSTNCRNKYKFRLGWRFILLEPMDLVTLTEPLLGLDHEVVRILTIEEDEEGYLAFLAEEWPFGVATPTLYTTQSSEGAAPNTNADPGNAFGPVAWEAPAMLSGGGRQLVLSASGGPIWGGCEVWISEDNATYSKAGSILAPGRHGHLSAPLAAGASLDETNTLHVHLEDERGQLLSVSDRLRDELQTLSWVDGELMAYRTATLEGTGAYALTSLRRGAYGTLITSHAVNAKFARVDGSTLFLDLPATRTGPLYLKLRSWNVWGGGLQDISTLPVFSYTLAGTISLVGATITGLCTSFRSGQLWLIWDALPITGIQYEIRKGETWADGRVLGVISPNELQTQGDGDYWVAARLDNALGVPCSITITGANLVANVVQTYVESNGWPGALSGGAVVNGDGALRLTGGTLFESLTGNFDSLTGLFDDLSGLSAIGEYEVPASHIVDLGIAQPCTITTSYGYTSETPTTTDARLFIAIAGNGGVFGPWAAFAPGQFYGRRFKLKVVLTCSDLAGSSPLFGPWTWTVDMPDRVETRTGITTPASGAYTWTYDRAFMVPPNVQLTVLNGAASDVIVDDGKDTGHCSFHITNGGATVSRIVNALAQGY